MRPPGPLRRPANGSNGGRAIPPGLAYDDLKFSCGCREIRHFYHDGSMRVRTIRHDGKVLKDEHSGDHEA